MRSPRIVALIAQGGRLAALLGLVFPVVFAIGWLFQAGRLLGYGVPLEMVTPDPVQLVVSAVTGTLLLFVGLGGIVALHGAYVRIGAHWRVRLYLIQLPLSMVLAILLVLNVEIGIDLQVVAIAFFVLVLQPLFMAPTFAAIYTRADLAKWVLAAVLVAPGPFGFVLATDDIRNKTEGDVIVTISGELAGLSGRVVGKGCAYDGLQLLQIDQSKVVMRRPGQGGVWVVPTANVVSIALGGRDVAGPTC